MPTLEEVFLRLGEESEYETVSKQILSQYNWSLDYYTQYLISMSSLGSYLLFSQITVCDYSFIQNSFFMVKYQMTQLVCNSALNIYSALNENIVIKLGVIF